MASVADDIDVGVVALLGTLGLTGATVVSRKVPAVREGETPPVVCVAISEDHDEWETADDATGRAGFYRLTVTIVRRTAGTLADKATVREWRQKIRRKLTEGPGLAGVPAVDWADSLPSPEWEPGLLDDAWDYSTLAFSVKTREPRT